MKTLLRLALLGAGLSLTPVTAQQLMGIHPPSGSTPPLPGNLQYDLVMVFDGYTAPTAAGQATADATAFRTALFSYAPYSQYAGYFNIWGIYRQSNQGGVDHPETSTFRDTAYNAAYNQFGVQRCVLMTDTQPQPLGTSQSGLTQALIDAATLPPDSDGAVLCMVNDPIYGGCAQFAGHGAAYNGTSVPNGSLVAVHELGHLAHFVHDEYNGAGVYTGAEPPQANVTTVTSPLKWQPFVTAGLVGPPVPGGLGFNTGVWHPDAACMMNDGQAPFCPVCAEQIVLDIYANAEPVLGTSPAAGATATVVQGQTQVFTVNHRIPGGNGVVSWTVGGTPWTVGTSLTINTTGWAPGNYAVQATVTDTNPLVLNDPSGVMTRTLGWTLTVSAPTPDLQVTGLSSFLIPLEPGQPVDIFGTLDNTAGTGPANNLIVSYYLMSSPGLPDPATDTYLGTEYVPSVAAGGTAQLLSQYPLPHFLAPGTYYVGAVADPSDSIAELDESNNRAGDLLGFPIVPLTSCPTALEFNAPGASVAATQMSMSAAAGASLALEVTAPCHANEWFVVLLSATGTSPGIVLAPGVVVPVTQDAATDQALPLLNVPPFINFLGQLDANGRGTALLAPPPGYLSPGGFPVFLGAATLQLTDPPTFTSASNAVVLAVFQ